MDVIPPTQKDADELNKYLKTEIEKLPPCPYCGGRLSVNANYQAEGHISNLEARSYGLISPKDKDYKSPYWMKLSAVVYCKGCTKNPSNIYEDMLTLPIPYTIKSREQMIKAMHDLINGFKAFWYWEYKERYRRVEDGNDD